MDSMDSDELKLVLEKHKLWLDGKSGGVPADLTDADLRSSNLADANLYGANLRNANLYGANLAGANLAGAKLAGANLAGANLRNANLYGANLAGANLVGANLAGANLAGANLRNANLYGANLAGAYLRSSDLADACLADAYLADADLADVDLSRANLAGAKLAGADLSRAKLADVDLAGADLRSSDLAGAKLYGANLADADLAGAKLAGANLAGANLADANLADANLYGANLRNANLADANLYGANLRNANLADANVTGTTLDIPKPETRLALGKKRQAIRKAVASPGIDAASFKRQFPEAHAAIGADIAGRPLSPAVLQQIIDKYGFQWAVTKSKYTSELQRISPKPNDVLQLNIDITAITSNEKQRKHMIALRDTSVRSGHPVIRAGNLFTVGWVRYSLGEVLLVEEVQSDLPVVRHGLKDPGFRRRMVEQGVSPEEIESTLALLAPFASRFYEDAMSLVFDVALEAGVEVEMLTYETKKGIADKPPESVYTQLPKSLGMKVQGTSRLLPGVGEVWRAKPNPARRRGRS